MTATPWRIAPPPQPAEPNPTNELLTPDVIALVRHAALRNPRHGQVDVGASELGTDCDRQLAYRLAGTHYEPKAGGDPWRPLIGTAIHAYLADAMNELNSSRFLVEYPIQFRGVPGVVDLYDRELHAVVDWKTSTRAKISQMRRNGVPNQSHVQVQVYASGLAMAGESPEVAALAYLPLDGRLDEMWVYAEPWSLAVANYAVARRDELIGADPADVEPTPSRMCGYCRFYDPSATATDLRRACPGRKG
jgi:hypothetical protein